MSRTTTDIVMSDLKPTHSVQLSQPDAEELVRNFIGVERQPECPNLHIRQSRVQTNLHCFNSRRNPAVGRALTVSFCIQPWA